MTHDSRSNRIAALAAAVGDDGTGDLGVIVDHAAPDATTEDLAEIVREARAEALSMNESIPGIKTTYPYETTSPGVARYQCEECGAWERADKDHGRLAHNKRCDSRPQPPAAASAIADEATKARRSELERFARQVKRTHMTHGRDADVRECVRLGLLTENDAMNTDD